MTRITVILSLGLLLCFSSAALADYRGDRGGYAGQRHYKKHVGRHHKKHHRRHHGYRSRHGRHYYGYRGYRHARRHHYHGPVYGRYGYPGPAVVIVYQAQPGYYRYDY